MRNTNENIYLIVYVDDIIIAGPNLSDVNEIKRRLMNRFVMKDKGHIKKILGLRINYDRDKGILRIDQSRYTNGILNRFGMTDCKGSALPIDPKLNISLCNDSKMLTKKPIRELVGCLMYLMLGSRPDICFSVNYFSRFQDKSSDKVWNHLKRVLRYLKLTVNVGLEYVRNNENNFCCYVDADWGGDTHDRKSVSGFVFKLFNNTLLWVTRKQTCVSLSTTEAELVALCDAVRDGLWLRKLISDLGVSFNNVTFFEDNQGCLSLIKNPSNNKRVKHIDLKFHFICEYYNSGIIHLKYIPSDNQQADILTKGLHNVLFVKFKDLLGLKEFSEEGC